ncbi:hypothetical protein E2320_012928 [Naja naja]|nr:hypothetical protein E2320_012928 [Naja naja]
MDRRLTPLAFLGWEKQVEVTLLGFSYVARRTCRGQLWFVVRMISKLKVAFYQAGFLKCIGCDKSAGCELETLFNECLF